MTTARSIILSSVANTLTTVYTNTTGKTSALKSVNISGIGDPQTLNTIAGGDEWLYFGTNMAPLIPNAFGGSGNYGYSVPISVPLSANRLLLIWQPDFMHNLAQNDLHARTTIHTQIVEYTGTKYRAGPIVNVDINGFVGSYTNSAGITLHTKPESSSIHGSSPSFKAIALSPTKVACTIRAQGYFQLFRLSIVGNSVELSGLTNLNLTTGSFLTTSYHYDIAPVSGSTTQITVLGADGTSWKIRSFNVPDTGAITALGTIFDTTITHSTYMGAVCRNNKTAVGNLTYYTVACTTSATAGSIRLISYDNSTNTFVLVGAAAALTAASGAWRGIKAECLSADTTSNAVVVTNDDGNTTLIRTYMQTSTAAATNTLVNLTINTSVSTRTISFSFRWGDSRAVFVGDNSLFMVDSAGTGTDLISNINDSTSTTAYRNLWYNFESKPLYTFYDPGLVQMDRIAQYYSRTGMTSSTNSGVRTSTGNYFPWGPEYGNHYDWSEVAGCWMVAQYGKIYAINIDGVILDEISLNNLYPDLSSTTFQMDIRNLIVLPSGRLLMCIAPYTMTHPTYTHRYTFQWVSSATTGYAISTQPILNPKDLNRASNQTVLGLSTFAASAHLTSHVDFNGEERAYLLWHDGAASPVTQISQYYGTGWQTTTSTSFTTAAAGAWNVGYNSTNKLIQDTPATALYPRGLWRIIGNNISTLAETKQLYVSQIYDILTSASSLSPVSSITLNNTGTYSRYGITANKSKNIAVVATHNPRTAINTPTHVWSSIEGKLNSPYGWYAGQYGTNVQTSNSQYTSIAVSSRGYAVAFNSTSGVSNAISVAYVFDSLQTATPRVTFANTSNSGFYTLKAIGDTTFQVYNAANATNSVVDAVYTLTGNNDTAKFTLALFDGSNTFFIANQSVSTSNTTYVRTNDTYLLANNNSIRIASDKPYALSALLTFVEEV